jgi:hypothetical protein
VRREHREVRKDVIVSGVKEKNGHAIVHEIEVRIEVYSSKNWRR